MNPTIVQNVRLTQMDMRRVYKKAFFIKRGFVFWFGARQSLWEGVLKVSTPTVLCYELASVFGGKMLSKEEVQKVAQLSRLQLTEAELEEYSKQLSHVLDYFHKLSEVNTDDVEELLMASPIENITREDKAEESMGVEKALANAPDRSGNLFKVPPVV